MVRAGQRHHSSSMRGEKRAAAREEGSKQCEETAARRVRQARSDRRGKREDRDSHDEDERVEGRKSLVPEGRDGTEKGRPLRKKWRSAGRSEETETNNMKMRGRDEGRMQRTRRRVRSHLGSNLSARHACGAQTHLLVSPLKLFGLVLICCGFLLRC